ncbi:MAG: holo-ACP synthase [Bacteroidota bacterium]
MIIGIGCDIVNHELVEKLNWSSDLDLQHRILSDKEYQLYQKVKDIKFIAGRFAAKEAVVKCLGTGMEDGISLTNIQIHETIEGAPQIVITGPETEMIKRKGIKSWHVSISHTNGYSMALVIAEGN